METIARNQATVAQIQRLEDADANPLTGKAWPKNHGDILKGRRNLRVYGRFEEILDVYHKNQVFILSGETGSGKSTQVPQMLVFDEFASGLRIACTQPRRLAATALADRVAEEMGVALGEEVGFQIGGQRMLNQNKKKTRLSYMTDGVLLRQLARDKDLSQYACIIIDEAHERTVEADILTAMLKKIVQRRKDLKVIIMSASMNTGLFQDYFNKCPLVHVTGRNFQVQTLYAQKGEVLSDFSVLAARVVVHIHENQAPGDILVFLPGQGEITEVCDMVRENTEGLDIFPLYSALSGSEQVRALQSTGGNRKCIVSTNIAETSLTINGVVYVVDTGLSKQMMFNPRFGMDMLRIMPISQASAQQRAGRAGRVQDGVCYRLYSKEDFDRLDLYTLPAIHCKPFHSTALHLLAFGYPKILDFDWVESPHPETIARAIQDLQDWELIDDKCQITRSGRLAQQFTLDPSWYRAIEVGVELGCSMDIVDIALVCSSQKSIFTNKPEFRELEDLSRMAFAAYPSDHLALLNAFGLYMRAFEHKDDPNFSLQEWCAVHFLDMQVLEEIRWKRQELGPFLKNVAKLPPTRASTREPWRVQKALAIAFCNQTAIFHATPDEYRTVHENVATRLSPLSSLLGGNYEWVVYTNFISSSGRVYIDIVTPIQAEWLLDLPYFAPERLPLSGDGSFRQVTVKQSLDAAKARTEASKHK